MLKAIIKIENGYSFYDDIHSKECLEGLKKGLEYTENRKVIGIIDIEKQVSYHACKKSALWDDITGYVDELQEEDKLKDDRLYIVTYYKYIDNGDLEHMVDFGITKEQIIKNVIEQKYMEGAEYYYINQLQKC